MKVKKSMQLILFFACVFYASSGSSQPIREEKNLIIGGEEIKVGIKQTIDLKIKGGYSIEKIKIPVTIIRGKQAGSTICMTGGIHGDELNGIEIVRRVLSQYSPKKIKGTLVGIPIVNILGFKRGQRYLPDRRDLNRYFPGNPSGSIAARVAYQVFEEIIKKCDYLIDFHTASFHRNNLPQVRANLDKPFVKNLAIHFGTSIVIHKPAAKGTLRRAAVDANIPTIIFEAGQPLRLHISSINKGVKGMTNILNYLKMIKTPYTIENNTFFTNTRWRRANSAGMIFPKIQLGSLVHKNDLLAEIIDPISNKKSSVYSESEGMIIGMALSQIVLPGYAIFHIGLKDSSEIQESVEQFMETDPLKEDESDN
ncbi:MAG: succinylglutamate desuccinylase/aspartoacylase family protein [Leptospiraceae bacterium]|nr:succinylglutamate desuccinylase/aspartoacylase family protein [Leptospiraceae bacterium]MCP5495954.1 succinylglutamate desuccinylase/aspartoacylase family protein [Leptospiraceae bacterium]